VVRGIAQDIVALVVEARRIRADRDPRINREANQSRYWTAIDSRIIAIKTTGANTETRRRKDEGLPRRKGQRNDRLISEITIERIDGSGTENPLTTNKFLIPPLRCYNRTIPS
jgi:hypothetical protein